MSTVARLRSPRYAAAVLVGVAYAVLIFANPAHSRHDRQPLDPSGPLASLAPLALAMLVAWWWVRGGFQRALAFTPAEADFLFPAPVRRWTLIAFKMFRAQPGVVLTAVLFVVLFPGRLRLWWPLALLSVWLAVTALQWHQLAASLVRANLAEHPTAAARRGTIPLAILVVAVIALLTGLMPELPALGAAGTMHDALAHVVVALQRPGPRVVLYPFRLLLAPVLAPDAAAWLRALPAVLVILALHFVWVLRMDAAFEEAAAEAGRKRAELKANRKKGLALRRPASKTVSRPWFDLKPTGRPSTAILWKNVLKFTREFRPGVVIAVLLAVGAVGIIVLSGTNSMQSGADTCTGVLMAFLVMTIVMSPIALRNDLRGDLRHMELLRTYPIRGRELVMGEIAGVTLSLALMQACLLAMALVFAALGSLGHAHPGLLATAAVLGLPILVTVTAVQCTIQNSLALFFPAWVRDTASAGIEGMGQYILATFAAVLLLVLLLLPAAIVGGVVFAGVAVLWGALAGTIAAGIAACAALWGEIAGAVAWLGRVYDRLDPVTAGIVV